MITDWFEWHEVLLPVNHNYNIKFFKIKSQDIQ